MLLPPLFEHCGTMKRVLIRCGCSDIDIKLTVWQCVLLLLRRSPGRGRATEGRDVEGERGGGAHISLRPPSGSGSESTDPARGCAPPPVSQRSITLDLAWDWLVEMFPPNEFAGLVTLQPCAGDADSRARLLTQVAQRVTDLTGLREGDVVRVQGEWPHTVASLDAWVERVTTTERLTFSVEREHATMEYAIVLR